MPIPFIFQRVPVVLVVNAALECNCIRHYSASASSNLKKILLNMSRNKTHIADAQKQRLRIKEKASRYIPGTVNLQILGSGAPGAPASVYLFTDQSRYLFNCGEGTQRLAHEHKTKLARLEHIFMTRTSWQRIGGLPGLTLTVQDSGVPSLSLHGPPGLDELFKAMRRFVILKDLKVDAVDCEAMQRYDDAVLGIKYVPIQRQVRPSSAAGSSSSRSHSPCVNDTTDYYAHEGHNKNGRSSPVAEPSRPIAALRSEETSVMAFICQLKARPGALSLEKCVDKGVPAGPLLGQLKNGNDVTLADGTIVHAADVRAPDDPGPAFCVLDIPSEDYLESLEANEEAFAAHQSGAPHDDRAVLVIHFTPHHIYEHPIYQRFINRFPASTKHLVLNGTNKFSGYLAAHRIQCQLNQINGHVFPLLQESSPDASPNKRLKLDDNVIQIPDTAADQGYAASLTYFHLRPSRGMDRSIEPYICPEEYIAETRAFPGFTESLDDLKHQLHQNYANEMLNRKEDYPKIVFLGTGSCIPNKTRNVSSILVHTNKDSCILLDCGEGTHGQMVRFYGQDGCEEVYRKLKAIYVSHLHADHHIGLIGLLQERREIVGEHAGPLLLFAPKQMSSWLYFYDKQIEPIKHEYELIGNGDMLAQPLADDRITAMGLSYIETCLVRHCPHSFGVALEVAQSSSRSEPFKITYSGDTMPCDDLVELGRNSNVLIHEATMEDELEEQAKYKMHSTVTQAIQQGRRMNAKNTILTHFSQRYAKLPRIESELAANVFIAFDNMEVTESDMKYLHLLHPTFKLMFTDHCEEMEAKAVKRAFKAERALSRPTSPVAPTR